ncbi:MAG TPA: HD domain-containing protein [Gemmatimonadales bacterium]|nr:HD domain-containing protein [Gemmatimonadales bacterium]
MVHGYSDSIHHALAFCAKHHPGPISRYAGHNPLLSTANIAVILSRHQADDATIVAGVLKQLADASPPDRLATLQHNIASRFGGLVAAAVEAATEPRFDPLGRERTWKACRFETLARLTGSSPRVTEIWMATEIHTCGRVLTDIRRLGVEYARNVAPAPPEELLWWHGALLEVLEGRGADCRASMLSELRTLSRELGAYLAGR